MRDAVSWKMTEGTIIGRRTEGRGAMGRNIKGGLVWFGYRLGTKPRFARGRSGMAVPTPCSGTVQGTVGASAVGANRWQSRQSRSVSDLSKITFDA